MKKQIVNISKLQTAKVMAVLYLVASLPFVLLSMIPLFFGRSDQPNMPFWLLVAMPTLYMALGFVFTLLGAWIYNGVASLIGGIEFTTAEVSGD